MAEAGLNALHEWILEIGVEPSFSMIGLDRAMIYEIAFWMIPSMNVQPRGYKRITKEEIGHILEQSLE